MVKAAGVDCEIILHRGEDPYHDIIDEAVKHKVDMIVMGSHGRTGLKSLLVGRMTQRVLGHGSTAVLVAKVR